MVVIWSKNHADGWILLCESLEGDTMSCLRRSEFRIVCGVGCGDGGGGYCAFSMATWSSTTMHPATLPINPHACYANRCCAVRCADSLPVWVGSPRRGSPQYPTEHRWCLMAISLSHRSGNRTSNHGVVARSLSGFVPRARAVGVNACIG
jgi:hypothetical protein